MSRLSPLSFSAILSALVLVAPSFAQAARYECSVIGKRNRGGTSYYQASDTISKTRALQKAMKKCRDGRSPVVMQCTPRSCNTYSGKF